MISHRDGLSSLAVNLDYDSKKQGFKTKSTIDVTATGLSRLSKRSQLEQLPRMVPRLVVFIRAIL